MDVQRVDERALGQQGHGADFVVFVYEGGDHPSGNVSWSVDSLLLTDTDVPQVLSWLREHLPVGCCWSLAVVLAPPRPTPASQLDVAWIVGADVLNTSPGDRDADEQRVAEEMLERRHRVTLG